MVLQTTQQEVHIPFNNLGYEVIPEEKHLRHTNIQIRFDTTRSEDKLLPVAIIRQIFTTLETKRDRIDLFYSVTHKEMGLSKDTVNEHVQRLWEYMNHHGLWADELLVAQDPKELVFNSDLKYGNLPAILQGTSVMVRGPENLQIANNNHGMTTDEFIKAGGKFFGGKVLAYLSQHPSLMQSHDVGEDLEILGLRKGDHYYTDLDTKYSYPIKPFRASLVPSDERSDVSSNDWLECWNVYGGAVVGRKLSADSTFYKNKLQQLHAQVRNIGKDIQKLVE